MYQQGRRHQRYVIEDEENLDGTSMRQCHAHLLIASLSVDALLGPVVNLETHILLNSILTKI